MTIGKAITLYLIDGDPTGRIACELANWTGKGYKIPRVLLQESAKREDLSRAGIYFLIGPSEKDPDTRSVYVGEAENVYVRLTQHQDKDFWTDVLVFISKDENLNKAHVKYLEHMAHLAIQQAKRAQLENSVTPTRSAISEMEQAVMTEFFANLKLLTGTLGYRIFDPLIQQAPLALEQPVEHTPVYTISGPRGAQARAMVTNEGVVVLKGSQAANAPVSSTPPSTHQLREKLEKSGVLLRNGTTVTFTRDYLFPSPSTAASVVLFRSANGRTELKDDRARTLKQNEEASLPALPIS